MAYFGNTEPLDANAEVIIGPHNTDRADYVSGMIFSDQDGTIFIEQSGDGTNWDISTSYPITANDGKGFSEPLFGPYVRIRFLNGAADQGAFRLFAKYTSAGDS